MNILVKLVRDIIQIDTIDLLIEEANKKLINTFMIVNGEFVKIKEFNWDVPYITIIDTNKLTLKIKPKTLEVFFPEAGIYPTDGGNYFYLFRKPVKQWKLSATAEAYDFYNLYSTTDISTSKALEAAYKNKSKQIDVLPDKQIFIYNKLVGHIEGNNIVCKYERHKQDLIDWINNETI